ncbi:hypothetical protein tb265_28780 [Gemmatimonadetes bacterium T265]|nr:hypothetical protein tb265_28780 [Gemmatimonadetes bacterium T265]
MTESDATAPDGPPVFDVLVLAFPDGSTPIAIPVGVVREVARVDRVSAYPGAPADVSGVTAVRGHIVPVLDFAPSNDAGRAAVVIASGTRAIALSGASPARVAAARPVTGRAASDVPAVRLWSGRLLPVSGAVRLLGAARPDAANGPVLPLLDAAALIGDVVDDSDGGR